MTGLPPVTEPTDLSGFWLNYVILYISVAKPCGLLGSRNFSHRGGDRLQSDRLTPPTPPILGHNVVTQFFRLAQLTPIVTSFELSYAI